jgi:hypothetical protein
MSLGSFATDAAGHASWFMFASLQKRPWSGGADAKKESQRGPSRWDSSFSLGLLGVEAGGSNALGANLPAPPSAAPSPSTAPAPSATTPAPDNGTAPSPSTPPTTTPAPSSAPPTPSPAAPSSTPPCVSRRSGGRQCQSRDSDHCGDLGADTSYGIGRDHRGDCQATNRGSSGLRDNVSCHDEHSRISTMSITPGDERERTSRE